MRKNFKSTSTRFAAETTGVVFLLFRKRGLLAQANSLSGHSTVGRDIKVDEDRVAVVVVDGVRQLGKLLGARAAATPE